MFALSESPATTQNNILFMLVYDIAPLNEERWHYEQMLEGSNASNSDMQFVEILFRMQLQVYKYDLKWQQKYLSSSFFINLCVSHDFCMSLSPPKNC